jgi:hypothetical protein
VLKNPFTLPRFNKTSIQTLCSPRMYRPTTFAAANSTLARNRSFVSSGSLTTGKSGIGADSFDTGVSSSATSPSSKLADIRKKPAGHVFFHGVPTTDRVSRLDEGSIINLIIRTIKWRIGHEVQFSHVRVQSIHTLASFGTRAVNQGNFAIKPSLRPSSGPFVLHSHSKLRSLAPVLCMKVQSYCSCTSAPPPSIFLG